MEYIIYCDESVYDGKYYSDFFGGVLVRSTDFMAINTALSEKKTELNLLSEIKWTKVTGNYLHKYMQMVDLFFSFIKQNKLKVRIMFKEASQVPSHLNVLQINNRYSLLYYQFVKHAFGLPYHNNETGEPVYLRLYFDEIPYPKDQKEAFKTHIRSLCNSTRFRKANLKIRIDDIAEIDSSKHVIHQCMDIVLGSIAFMLNKKNEEIPEGATQRGKRTIAKEKLFFRILDLIKSANGCVEFDIGESTPADNPKDFWTTPYRHWKFVPAEFRKQK
ncbi:MAG: DUF3800 domain-containing protein [Candidatus Cryptobacteroides sp.]|jgi:hypothetical protein|nr:DUF3800 domain-containing protein [Bacteroidales bacterium]